jgi:endoglucanase
MHRNRNPDNPESQETPLRGVNFGGWFSQIDAIEQKDPKTFPGFMEHLGSFLGADDFRRVGSWGFDHVRLPVDWSNVFHEESVTPREDVLLLLDKAFDDARAAGLEVILDLHRCPGHDFESGIHQEQSFFSDPSMRKDCLRVWAVLAERYGHRPGVLLELLNEPVAPNPEIWNTVKDELAREIRRFAPQATLVVGANLWNNSSQFEFLTPVDDDNILYSVHVYNPVVFTHQKAPWIPSDLFQIERTYPGHYDIPEGDHRLPVERGTWDKKRLAQLLQPVFHFRETYQAKVACNEFGVYMGGPDRTSHLNWMRDILELFQENQIGWSYWNYKNLDFGIVSKGEALYQELEQYSNPERIDHGLLEILRKSGPF